MKVIQQVVDRELEYMRSTRKSLKEEVSRLVREIPADGEDKDWSTCLVEPYPFEARKAIRAYEKKISETNSSDQKKTQQLATQEKAIENAILIAKFFSFNT